MAVENTPIIPASLPPRSELIEIIGFNDKGELRVEKRDAMLVINDDRFQKLNPDQLKISRDFFVGKLIARKRIADQSRLDLPIELFESACFTMPTRDQNRPGCPILLQP